MRIALSIQAVLIALFILFGAGSVYAAASVTSEENIMAAGFDIPMGRTDVRGELPTVVGLSDMEAEHKLNWRIEDFRNEKADEAAGRAKEVVFSYDVREEGDFLTLMIYCDTIGDITDKSALILNIDPQSAELVDIFDIAGPNIVRILNKAIADDAKRTPGKYNSVLHPVDGERNFYLDGDKLVLIFDDMEISPRRDELFKLTLDLTKYKDVYTEPDDYRNADGDEIQMLRLKTLEDEFGYALDWQGNSRKAEIYLGDEFCGALTIGENAYEMRGTRKKLEAPPEIYGDNRIYVPLTFFSEVLGMAVDADDEGRLCISDYQGRLD